jgi:hypothetical protein
MDLTAVSVSDVTASGMVTFAVTVSGFGTLGGSSLHIELDTDRTSSTGTPPTGADYLVGASCCTGDGSIASNLAAWTGGAWHSVAGTPASFSHNGDVFTWTVNKADLGGTAGFAFFVESAAFDAPPNYKTVVTSDRAPDTGTWTYELSKPPPPPITTAPVVKPLIGTPTLTPAKPIAGKRLIVVFTVTRSDTGAPLTQGTMICDPSVAGRVIAHSEQLKNGKAQLIFVVPRTAKGKLLKVKLTIRTSGGSSTKVANFAVH